MGKEGCNLNQKCIIITDLEEGMRVLLILKRDQGGFGRGWDGGYERERCGFYRIIEKMIREVDDWLVAPSFAFLSSLYLYHPSGQPRYNYNNDRMSSVKKKQMGESSVIVGGLNRL